jgi:CheY-like chemotaxis protein
VDDVPDNRQVLLGILEMVGFDCREAEDGMQAVELFTRWDPHLVLMDLRMPRMGGADAIAQIRRLAGGSQVKIIALTASAFDEDRNAVLAVGADDFLGKPFRATDLLDRLWTLLPLEFVLDAPVAHVPTESARGLTRRASEAPLTTLPWKAEKVAVFRRAADTADLPRLQALIAELHETHAELAMELHSLLERFDYPGIMARIDPGGALP